MSVDQDNSKYLSNLKRQSLRLRDALDVPLNVARLWLAKFIYQEKDMSEIQRKIKNRDFDGYVFLSQIEPRCDWEVYDRFCNEKPRIIKGLDGSPVAEKYGGDLIVLLDKVFGV